MKRPRVLPAGRWGGEPKRREKPAPLGAGDPTGGMISAGSTTLTSGTAVVAAVDRWRPRTKRERGTKVLLTIMQIKIDKKKVKHNTL